MSRKTKKLWQKEDGLDPLVEQFTVDNDREADLQLARWDVIGSLAHAHMLHKVKLIDAETFRILRQGLKAILKEIESGRFVIEQGVEDVHSQVELLLTRQWPDAGARLHTGRSRNDQILVDLRLFARAEIKAIVHATRQLFDVLTELSERHKEVLLPGYTHFQIAMPSSFGLWLGAYAESLVDDLIQLQGAYRLVNKNPLGSAAGYGSAFPLDRTLTTRLLGFETLNFNSVYAQMGRGKTERIVTQAIGGLAETIGKLAADIVLFQSQNFGFLHFPASVTTGSSIMPHKKNPDVFEIVRGKCNRLKAVPNEIQMLTTNLPSGYHRDLQLLKEPFLRALKTLRDVLHIMAYVLPKMEVKENILSERKYQSVYTVEAINQLVRQGVPFRQAYHQIARQTAEGTFVPPEPGSHTHEGSIGRLCTDEIRRMMETVVAEFRFEQWEKAIRALIEAP
jgi:argininosuccinate lyase